MKIDTYGNAFNYLPTGSGWTDKTTKIDANGNIVDGMTPWHHERKFEIDSLGFYIYKIKFYSCIFKIDN